MRNAAKSLSIWGAYVQPAIMGKSKMTQEQPLVSIGEIAEYLKCSKATARKELKRKDVPVFYIGRHIAIYPSTLKRCCEGTYCNGAVSES